MSTWEVVPGTNQLRHSIHSVDPTRVCACGCGQVLTGKSTQKFFSDACRKRYIGKRTVLRRPFVALDGEGIRDRYVLLAAADQEGWYRYIGTKQGLDTETCLEFLLRLPRGSNSGRKPIYVWFAFDYDVNMILGDIPLRGSNSLEELRKEGGNHTINWHGFRITYLHRKIFRVARGNRRHTSYDVWGFFQGSFERSLQAWGIESSEVVREGKASRTGFATWSLARIRDYNQEELIQLATLAEKLREAVAPLQLPVQSWHGPAALAQAWFQKHKVKRFLEPTPERMQDAVSRAYFGGRIDAVGYGYVNPVYHYDIVSAYPSATRNLPDLSKLSWVHKQKSAPDSDSIYLAHIRWSMPPVYWGALPWRDRAGTILWPCEGEGWYWKPEIEAAYKRFGREYFQVLDYWQAEGDYQFPFRELIEETFVHRAKLKAEGNPAHVPAKLILNSLYGKFAQTVGRASYHSLIWAGLITAQTRAQLANALTDDVVCVMTDSIWSRKPLSLPIGKQLGDWEQQDEVRLWLAEAGLYEAETASGKVAVWQRGFDKRNPVNIRKLVDEWLHRDDLHTPVYKVTRFIGMGLALQTHYPWRQWVEIKRKIQPVALVGTSKREPLYPITSSDVGALIYPNFVQLPPRNWHEDTCSYPYRHKTLDEKLIRERLEEECSDE